MNERIRELYYECQDESQSTEQCYQTFAELIVKEIESYIEEAEGDIDLVQFLIDRYLK